MTTVDNQEDIVGVHFRQGGHVWHTPMIRSSSESREVREDSPTWIQVRNIIEHDFLPIVTEVLNEYRRTKSPSSSPSLLFGGTGGGNDRTVYEYSVEWLNTNNVPKWNTRLRTLGYSIQAHVTKQSGSSCNTPTVISGTAIPTAKIPRTKRRKSLSEIWSHLKQGTQFGLFLSISIVPDWSSHVSFFHKSSPSSQQSEPPRRDRPTVKTTPNPYTPPPCPVDNPVIPTTPIPNIMLLESMDIRFTPVLVPSPNDAPTDTTVTGDLPCPPFSCQISTSREERAGSLSPRHAAIDICDAPHTPCSNPFPDIPTRSRTRSRSRARPPTTEREPDAHNKAFNADPARRSQSCTRSRSRSRHKKCNIPNAGKRSESQTFARARFTSEMETVRPTCLRGAIESAAATATATTTTTVNSKSNETISKKKKKVKIPITTTSLTSPPRRPCGHVFLGEMSEMSSITLQEVLHQSEIQPNQQQSGKELSPYVKRVFSETHLSPCMEESLRCRNMLTDARVIANTSPQKAYNDDADSTLCNKIKPINFPNKTVEKSPIPSTMEGHAAQQKHAQMWNQLLSMPTKAEPPLEDIDNTMMDNNRVTTDRSEKVKYIRKGDKMVTLNTNMGKIKHKKSLGKSVDQVLFPQEASLSPKTRRTTKKQKSKKKRCSIDSFLHAMEITESNDDPDILTVILPIDTNASNQQQ